MLFKYIDVNNTSAQRSPIQHTLIPYISLLHTRTYTQTLKAQECHMIHSFFLNTTSLCLFRDTHIPTEKNGSGMSVLLIWLFCFVVDPIAWVCIHGQFLQALPVKPGMRVSSPTPISGIVHSIWLSLTHTTSCLRGSHEPVLPPRKETFVTHGPVSHDYTVQTQKGKNSYVDWSFVHSPWISLSYLQVIQMNP